MPGFLAPSARRAGPTYGNPLTFRRARKARFRPNADIRDTLWHQSLVAEPYRYGGSKAGAIASGVFAAGCTFIVCYFLAVFFIVMPEGRSEEAGNPGVAFDLALIAGAVFSLVIGCQTKRFFDRRAGRH